MTELNDIDVYELLNIPENAVKSDISRAYRRASLKYHPDKNPSEDAAIKFHLLTQALELLNDTKARQIYDEKRAAKKQQEIKRAALNAERRNLQKDLESREANATWKQNQQDDLNIKIEQIRKANEKKRKLHQENIDRKFYGKSDKDSDQVSQTIHHEDQQLHENQKNYRKKPNNSNFEQSEELRSIKVKFEVKNVDNSSQFNDMKNHKNSHLKTSLNNIFKNYGEIEHILVLPTISSNEKNVLWALIIFSRRKDAEKVVSTNINETPEIQIKSIKLLETTDKSPSTVKKEIDHSNYHQSTLERLRMKAKSRK